MDTEAYAGHAGETGNLFVMPHELLGGIIVLALLALALVILGGLAVRQLYRIERRLQTLEQVLMIEKHGATASEPQN